MDVAAAEATMSSGPPRPVVLAARQSKDGGEEEDAVAAATVQCRPRPLHRAEVPQTAATPDPDVNNSSVHPRVRQHESEAIRGMLNSTQVPSMVSSDDDTSLQAPSLPLALGSLAMPPDIPKEIAIEEEAIMYLNEQQCNQVMKTLKIQREEGHFCDIALVVKGSEPIWAHKCVLVANSAYFSALVQHDHASQQIQVPTNDVRAFESLLDYMYTGQLSVSMAFMEELLALCQRLGIDDIKHCCSMHLEKNLDISNWFGVWSLAYRFKLDDVVPHVHRFAQENFSLLAQTPDLLELDEEALRTIFGNCNPQQDGDLELYVLEVILKWVMHDYAARLNAYRDLLRLVDAKLIDVDRMRRILGRDLPLDHAILSLPVTAQFSAEVLEHHEQQRQQEEERLQQAQEVKRKKEEEMLRERKERARERERLEKDSREAELHRSELVRQSEVEESGARDDIDRNEERRNAPLAVENMVGKEDQINMEETGDDTSYTELKEKNSDGCTSRPKEHDIAMPAVSDISDVDDADLDECRTKGFKECSQRPPLADGDDILVMKREEVDTEPQDEGMNVQECAKVLGIKLCRIKTEAGDEQANSDVILVGEEHGKRRRRKPDNPTRIPNRSSGRKPKQLLDNVKSETVFNSTTDEESDSLRDFDPEALVRDDDYIPEADLEEFVPGGGRKCRKKYKLRPPKPKKGRKGKLKGKKAKKPITVVIKPPKKEKKKRLKTMAIQTMTQEDVMAELQAEVEDEEDYAGDPLNQDWDEHKRALKLEEQDAMGRGPPRRRRRRTKRATTEEDMYQCLKCPRRFGTPSALRHHMKGHGSETPFLCEICGFSTRHFASINVHKRIHNGKKFKCEHPGCHSEFIRKSRLEDHMNAHMGVKNHVCSVCGKAFAGRKHMQRHEKIHCEVKPVLCTECDYRTTRNDKLKDHIRKHHTGTAVVMGIASLEYVEMRERRKREREEKAGASTSSSPYKHKKKKKRKKAGDEPEADGEDDREVVETLGVMELGSVQAIEATAVSPVLTAVPAATAVAATQLQPDPSQYYLAMHIPPHLTGTSTINEEMLQYLTTMAAVPTTGVHAAGPLSLVTQNIHASQQVAAAVAAPQLPLAQLHAVSQQAGVQAPPPETPSPHPQAQPHAAMLAASSAQPLPPNHSVPAAVHPSPTTPPASHGTPNSTPQPTMAHSHHGTPHAPTSQDGSLWTYPITPSTHY